jgi:hypothetical protein
MRQRTDFAGANGENDDAEELDSPSYQPTVEGILRGHEVRECQG